jgi:hypothetical protein
LTDDIDFLEDAIPAASDADLATCTKLANDMVTLEGEADALEELAKEKRKEALHIAQVKLPDVMAQIGLTFFGFGEDKKIELNTFHSVSITDESKAMAWLRDNGHGGLIKTTVTLEFPRNTDNLRGVVVSQLQEMPEWLASEGSLEEKTGVHASTLKSWAKEVLPTGTVTLPEDAFKVYTGTVAKVATVRKSNRKKRS